MALKEDWEGRQKYPYWGSDCCICTNIEEMQPIIFVRLHHTVIERLHDTVIVRWRRPLAFLSLSYKNCYKSCWCFLLATYVHPVAIEHLATRIQDSRLLRCWHQQNFRHTECVSVETGTRFSNFLLVSSFDIQLSRVLRQAARLQEGSIAQDFAVLAPTNLRHTECVSVETGTRFTIFPLAYFVSWNCCESIEGSRVLSAVFGVDSVIGKHI